MNSLEKRSRGSQLGARLKYLRDADIATRVIRTACGQFEPYKSGNIFMADPEKGVGVVMIKCRRCLGDVLMTTRLETDITEVKLPEECPNRESK